MKYLKYILLALLIIFILVIVPLCVYKYLNKKINTDTEIKTTETELKNDDNELKTHEKGITSNTDIQDDIPKKEYKYPKLNVTGEKEYVGKTSNGYSIYQINNVYYVDDYLIVNKSYPLPSDFEPDNTYTSSHNKVNTCNTCIEKQAYKAFLDMQSEATAMGLNIKITSGYRSYKVQEKIYNNYVNRDGIKKADTYSARPGYSEHQSGLAFDLNSISDAFAKTNEGVWVNNNAYRYGFIIRYPKNKEKETGYKYESWHLRYVGKELAEKLYNDGDWISIEDYFGLKSEYKD